ncbi:MAG: DUF1353 domain-containing protein, partial [Emcibacteraceae bacterium]|nr:DUF1353 domain-containing protein [Emcibacteraceae bacterium]
KFISFKKGYKFQLHTQYIVATNICPENDVPSESGYIHLSSSGVITIEKGYAWDGPSGPTVDTKNFMRGSLVHDAFYQMMREGALPQDYRLPADELLRSMCKEDGMSGLRRWWVYKGVRLFAKKAAMEKSKKELEYAPKNFDESS